MATKKSVKKAATPAVKKIGVVKVAPKKSAAKPKAKPAKKKAAAKKVVHDSVAASVTKALIGSAVKSATLFKKEDLPASVATQLNVPFAQQREIAPGKINATQYVNPHKVTGFAPVLPHSPFRANGL